MKVFLCVREYKTIDNYPSIKEQIEQAKDYADSNGLTIVNITKDDKSEIITCEEGVVNYCVNNKITSVLAYDYRILAYRSIDRVKLSKELYTKNIKILFFG